MREPKSRTLPDLLDEVTDSYGNRDFIHCLDQTLSYREFRSRARVLARSMMSLGVKPGDKVAVWAGNQIEWVLLFHATAMVGGVFVALNTWWRSRELRGALDSADVNWLFYVDRFQRSDFQASIDEIGDLSKALPKLRGLVCIETTPSVARQRFSFKELLDLESKTSDADLLNARASVQPDDVALILFTSGSTAFPKAVQNCHFGLIRNPFQIGERAGLTEEDCVYAPISLFWGLGVGNALMAVTTHGASLVLQNRFDPVEGLALIEKHHCTALYSTPNIAQSLFDTTAAATFNLGSLRRGLSLPAGIAAMVALGARDACSIYGLSECYGNSTVSHFSDALEVRQRTCGSVLPNTELVIADPLTHQPVVAGETGEIKIKGYVTPGYYNAPALTASAFDDDGYFLTGDLGMLDIQGNLHFKGRLKEIVKSGGINISPAEVEDLLLTHEHVQQALVVGVADAVLEQALVAVVVLTSDDAVSDEDLKEFCRGRAASYKVPRRFVRMKLSDIPLTASGKYDKVTLASLL